MVKATAARRLHPSPTWITGPGTIRVHDLNATILHLQGIDPKKLAYRYQGRGFRPTDIHRHVTKDILS